jgi:hypothetical protein
MGPHFRNTEYAKITLNAHGAILELIDEARPCELVVGMAIWELGVTFGE